MTVGDLVDRVHRINVEHGWDSSVPVDRQEVFSEKMLLVISEISEALEEWRNHRGLNEIYYDDSHPGKPEGIPIELADALIRIFDFCAANEIEIERALGLKLDYNEIRPYRHGGKKA